MSQSAKTREESASRRAVDRITVRALRHAFAPDFDPEEAGLDLARLAGSRSALRAAQDRVGEALDSQWSDVADRARNALHHASRTVGADPMPGRDQDRCAEPPSPVGPPSALQL
jgi:hypothetical protein